MLGVKIFSRKSGPVPGFTTILKCTHESDGIVVLHVDGKALQEEICFANEMRRPNSERKCAPSALQAQEFRRRWGQTHGLQAIMHIWQSCEQQPAQLQNLPRLLSASSMMQHKCGPLWHPRPCIFQQTRE